MKRIIKEYKSLSDEHVDLINRHYPNGFENENLISFVTPKGEFIKALEIKTDDAIYLFKIDKNMEVPDDENQVNESMAMSEFENFKGDDSDDDDEDDVDDSDELSGGGEDDGGEEGGDDEEDY